LRLLLDEMYPAAIAQQLCVRGHDVAAATARPELRAFPDDAVFATAQQESRAVVTENIGAFSSIADAADQRGHAHHGPVLLDPAKCLRRNRRTIGRRVTDLDRLLNTHRHGEATSLRMALSCTSRSTTRPGRALRGLCAIRASPRATAPLRRPPVEKLLDEVPQETPPQRRSGLIGF
jgi:Domain of unknown function (DUF5615)